MPDKLTHTKRIPKLRNPYFIAAWPGMGQVAFNAVKHILESLQFTEFAHINSEDIFYPTHITIANSTINSQETPFNKFYYWKNKLGQNDLLVFLSNAQPDLARSKEYCNNIVSLAKDLNAKLMFTFASMPLPIDHIQKPGIWITATEKRLLNDFKKFHFKTLTEGKISGMNGLILSKGKEIGIDGVCILAEIPIYTIQIDNPKASASALEAFCSIVNISIDIAGLSKHADEVEEEINKLVDYLKNAVQPEPIEEEEIDNIRNVLSSKTRVPNSAIERIEQLFSHAKKDITKATELKKELDKWNIYKDYEDRFLDLFRKLKEKNN